MLKKENEKMPEYLTIEKKEIPYMLPIHLSYGYVHIYCDKYEIDNDYFYAYVRNQIILGISMIDIIDINFVWRC
jgi:hypothetical protein